MYAWFRIKGHGRTVWACEVCGDSIGLVTKLADRVWQALHRDSGRVAVFATLRKAKAWVEEVTE